MMFPLADEKFGVIFKSSPVSLSRLDRDLRTAREGPARFRARNWHQKFTGLQADRV